MSNPPEGWYPDPTGQPNTIRWWNGTQWTNKTEKEALEEPAETTPAAAPSAADSQDTDSANSASAKADAAAVSAAEKAKSTWMETPAQNVASGHWTQQPRPEPEPEVSSTPPADAPEQKAWTLTLATDPTSTPTTDPATDGGTEAGDSPEQTPAKSWGQDATQSWTTTPDWNKQEPKSSPTSQHQSGSSAWQASAGAQTGFAPWQAAAGQQAGAGQRTVPGSQQSETNEQQAGIHHAGPVHAGAGQWQAGGAQGGVREGGGGGQRGAMLGGGGDGPGGRPSKVVVIVSSVVGLVLIIIAASFFVTNRSDDDTADPSTSPSTQPTDQPTGSSSPTSSTSPPPTTPGGQSTIPPGQSKDPKLHEGARISSAAISYPRQKPPWSDRKRLVPQLENSSGQYVVLQEKFDGKNDWYADMFVGSLGTSAGFNGNTQATASNLAYQLRSTMYGDIPVIIKPLRNGAVQRSGKSGWYYQQSVTASSTKVTARVLTLTVAVFDLGDGTAVAYISDIPTNRPDLRTVESQVYKGINVG